MNFKTITYHNDSTANSVCLDSANKSTYLRTIIIFAILAITGGIFIVGLVPSPAYATGVVDGITDAADALGDFFGGVVDTVSNAFNWVSESIETTVDFLSDPIGAITELLGGLIKQSINANFYVGEVFLQALATGDVFTRSFDLLLNANIIGVLKAIWNSITVPIGEVVVLVFFVIGLCNVFKTVGQSDAGIDLWQILMCYLMLVAGILLIQNSWYIMELIYTVSNTYMSNLADLISGQNIPMDAWNVADNLGAFNFGQYFFYWLLSMCAMVIGIVIYALSYGLIAIRGIQIYIYTIFSPIPLAMVVSEGTRRDAGMFFKRYLAVILSGFLVVILIVMLMVYLTQAGDLNFEAGGSVIELFNFSGNYIVGFIMPVIFAWAMVKSGKWSRDLLGIY